ncbi:MAG: hypothetical protein HY260_04715, partial [Chloroflexi bacterium]|nr:hypothetical protein [Chloroflexota bacterium]
WIEIVGGVLLIVGAVANLTTGGDVLQRLFFWSHEIRSFSDDPEFAITAMYDRFGRTLTPGSRFSYRFGVPLSARGVTDLADTERVWAVMWDEYGNYYLQYPPVSIRGRHWNAVSLHPLKGIIEIVFVKVDQAGDASLTQQAGVSQPSGDWRLAALPPNSEVVAYVELR